MGEGGMVAIFFFGFVLTPKFVPTLKCIAV